MVKSDAHMARVKDELIFQQKKMDAFEKRKERQHQLKYSKAVQAERLKQKAAQRKEALREARDLSKGADAARRRLLGDDDAGDPADALKGGGTPASSPRRAPSRFKKSSSRKQDAKDRKWGFGGRKRGAKRNDAKSIADMGDFRPKRGKAAGPHKRKAGAPAGGAGAAKKKRR